MAVSLFLPCTLCVASRAWPGDLHMLKTVIFYYHKQKSHLHRNVKCRYHISISDEVEPSVAILPVTDLLRTRCYHIHDANHNEKFWPHEAL